MEGRRLGRYRLGPRLATGGMAEIFSATVEGAAEFEKNIAIKRILPHLCLDSEFLEMFKEEARLASRLSHANIAQVFDFDIIDGQYFMAMEWVQGKDLRCALNAAEKTGKMPSPLHAAYIAGETAKALHHAHTYGNAGIPSGLIHRDVSPQNILLSCAGEVKLTDFGIAKAASRTFATEAGIVKGKIAYMSPEQARGEDIDHRSDIFALGTVLWEILTGRRLYSGNSDREIIRSLQSQPPVPPSAVRMGIPESLDKIVIKALSKKPENRHKNALELQVELTDFILANAASARDLDLALWLEELFGTNFTENPDFSLPAPYSEPGLNQKKKGGTAVDRISPPLPDKKDVKSCLTREENKTASLPALNSSSQSSGKLFFLKNNEKYRKFLPIIFPIFFIIFFSILLTNYFYNKNNSTPLHSKKEIPSTLQKTADKHKKTDNQIQDSPPFLPDPVKKHQEPAQKSPELTKKTNLDVISDINPKTLNIPEKKADGEREKIVFSKHSSPDEVKPGKKLEAGHPKSGTEDNLNISSPGKQRTGQARIIAPAQKSSIETATPDDRIIKPIIVSGTSINARLVHGIKTGDFGRIEARTTRSVLTGDLILLPRGSIISGKAYAENNRVMVNFKSLLLPSGRKLNLIAGAFGNDGRPGIPALDGLTAPKSGHDNMSPEILTLPAGTEFIIVLTADLLID